MVFRKRWKRPYVLTLPVGLDLRSNFATGRTKSTIPKTILLGILVVYSAYMTSRELVDVGYEEGLVSGYEQGVKRGYREGKEEACMINPITMAAPRIKR